jgi:D-alanine-D-alanine ligase
METKRKIGIIFGGQSPEHEVSKMTAQSIMENIDREIFEPVEIFIDKDGNFDTSLLEDIDVAFLAVHGPNCEDGKLQQFLEDKGMKYTGPKVKASEVNMDKILMHDAFKEAGLAVVKYLGFSNDEKSSDIAEQVMEKIGYPCFVKPNNAGSSIGVSKVDTQAGLIGAITEAFKYDNKIIVESGVEKPREVEVGILGNDDLTISDPGEVISNGEFYSYETKYFQPFDTSTNANLDHGTIEKVKELAQKAYEATGCTGYSRIDFLIDQNGEIFINEINTLPGFTKISMYPRLMKSCGIEYKDLITKIIELA